MSIAETKRHLAVVSPDEVTDLEDLMTQLLLGSRGQYPFYREARRTFMDVVADLKIPESKPFAWFVESGEIRLIVPNEPDSRRHFQDCHFLQVPFSGSVRNVVVLHANVWRSLDPTFLRPVQRSSKEDVLLPCENAVRLAFYAMVKVRAGTK